MPSIMTSSRHITPNPFDPDIDAYPDGPSKLLIIGPPGTGKTRKVLDCFIEPAMALGIQPSEILSCSFTRAAAKELRERLAKSTQLHPFKLMETCSTIHAEALRRFRVQFGLKGYTILGDKKISDPEEDDGPISRFLEEAMPEGFEIKNAQAIRIWDLARNKLIGDWNSAAFADMVLMFDPRANIADVKNWVGEYEKNKKQNKSLDFTDILIYGLRCTPPERELLIVDEAQDCSMLQWKLVEKWAAKAKKIIFVADFDQCAPTGSMVTLPNGTQRPIEMLQDEDRVVAFSRTETILVGRDVSVNNQEIPGFSVKTASRHYNGELVSLKVSGKSTRVTPDHRWIARWTDRAANAYVVYMMRQGARFRIGQCKLFAKKGSLNFGVRGRIEKADATWILNHFTTREEARAYEVWASTHYGIPQTIFQEVKGSTSEVSQDYIDLVFSMFAPDELENNAKKCLEAHHRDIDQPLWPPMGKRFGKLGRITIFDTYASNLMPKLMALPVPVSENVVDSNKVVYKPITLVSYDHYDGLVYSLAVDKHETYIQDGIVTRNCLYEWNGAYPEKLFGILNEGFVARRLTKSYRVPESVHKLARSIIVRNRNRIDAPYEPASKTGSASELSMRMAIEELAQAATDGRNAFVLARSAKLLECWVDALSAKGIPFLNERGKSPWGSPIALSVVRAIFSIRQNCGMRSVDARRLVEQFPGRNANYFKKKITKKGVIESLNKWSGHSVFPADLDNLGIVLDKLKSEQLEPLLTELDLKDRASTLAALIERNGPEVLNKTPIIVLTTMHGSKGREKELVVVEMSSPIGTNIAISKDEDGTLREAERRLCYVAFTRAKDSLIICRPGGYDLGAIIGMRNTSESER